MAKVPEGQPIEAHEIGSGVQHPRAPFRWAHTLRFIENFRITANEWTVDDADMLDDRSLTRAVYVEGLPLAFRVRSTGTLETPQLDYTLFGKAPVDDQIAESAADRIAFHFSIDDDLAPFYQIGRADPAFTPVIDALDGYHQVKFITPFENACWAILSQRNQFTVSRRMKTRLIEDFGGAIQVEGIDYPLFPEAPILASSDEEAINAAVGNLWKAQGILQVSRAFSDVDEIWLREAPYDEVRDWLMRIKGIGEWSASFILLRGLGRMESIPSTDKAIADALERVYGIRGALPADVERMARPYGKYAGYWAHYLRVSEA